MTAPRMTDPGRDWHPTPADLAAARDQTISDVITADLRVLFSGINPGLYSAATGHHFARPGNRFWPALHRSGLTSRQLHPSEQEQLLEAGLGSRTSSPGPRRELTGSIRPSCARVALRWPRK